MNSQMHDLLLTLDRAKLKGGDGWVSSNALRHIPQSIRSYAQQKGYITGKGNTAKRQYMITSAGRTMLANNASANMAVMDEIENGYVPTGDTEQQAEFQGLDRLIKLGPAPTVRIVPSGPAAISPTEKNNTPFAPLTQLGSYERACVQAVAILGESFPEVIDLVDSLVKINRRKAASHDEP